MTKKGSPFFKPASKACKRYYIETPIFVGDIGITRAQLKNDLILLFHEIEKIIVGLFAKSTGRSFVILVDFKKDLIPGLLEFKGKFIDYMASHGSIFNLNNFTFNSANNLPHAVKFISSNDFDVSHYGFEENSKWFSVNYRIEHWVRERSALGTFDMKENLKKKFRKGRKACFKLLKKRMRKMPQIIDQNNVVQTPNYFFDYEINLDQFHFQDINLNTEQQGNSLNYN